MTLLALGILLAVSWLFTPPIFLYPAYYRYYRQANSFKPASISRQYFRALGRGYAWFYISLAATLVSTMLFLWMCGGIPIWLLLAPVAVLQRFKAARTWWNLRNERWRYLQINPEPKVQLWLQDILVLSFSIGFVLLVTLSLLKVLPLQHPTSAADYSYDELRFFRGAVILGAILSSQLSAFIVALDVCRLSPELQTSRARLKFIVLMQITAAILPVFPVFYLAWWVWRRGLWAERIGEAQSITTLRW